MVPVSNRSHEERLGVDMCGTLWYNKRSGVVCLVFRNNVCGFAVLKHLWLFSFIGVRYKSGGIAGTSPSAILKSRVSLSSFLLCWRLGSFKSFSIFVILPGVLDL